MAKIALTNRCLTVKEAVELLTEKVKEEWITVVEVISFYGEWSQKDHTSERRIILNRNHIVEFYE
jgi:hypothetical protein